MGQGESPLLHHHSAHTNDYQIGNVDLRANFVFSKKCHRKFDCLVYKMLFIKTSCYPAENVNETPVPEQFPTFSLSVDLSSPRLLPLCAQFLTNKKIASQKPKSPLSDIQTNEDCFFFKLKRCHKLFLIPLPGILQMQPSHYLHSKRKPHGQGIFLLFYQVVVQQYHQEKVLQTALDSN